MDILKISHLKTSFFTDEGEVKAVDDVSFSIKEQETFGLVGESGCGKSVTSSSILRTLPMPPGKIKSGEIIFDDKNLVTLSEQEMRKIRGQHISMIFQEPMTSLNPVMKIGDQIIEPLLIHKKAKSKKEALQIGIDLLHKVGIPQPEKRFYSYPHELSGGMKQRAMIAMALSCNPKLLIADEPTTALDVTIQAQIIDLLQKLQDEFKMSILLITHNLGVVAENADKIAVMYAGKIVEETSTDKLFRNPLHPYTQGLIRSIPDISKKNERLYNIEGFVPSPINLPSGCAFAPRCPFKKSICEKEQPELKEIDHLHKVACFLQEEQNA